MRPVTRFISPREEERNQRKAAERKRQNDLLTAMQAGSIKFVYVEKRQLEQAANNLLKSARATEVETLRDIREAASKWHRELPKDQRQAINQGFKEARLLGSIRISFADWLIEQFGPDHGMSL